ncbi:hypothetical protein [Sagittula stellata]|uniref:2-isopropylmalate synthase n=1 Tax=Sagittula stellata (strain ATCC 700073 / DSM 11524 / E-37) TaxID=388399 RepID=A3K8V4_SAGS3|nr:hypothetical protein [Sagittula stellata]EBA06337.1 2-isopropylmalate synthase [Sagittula stellata E-37]
MSSDVTILAIVAAFVTYATARASGWKFSASRFLAEKLVRALYKCVGASYAEKKEPQKRSTAWDFAN